MEAYLFDWANLLLRWLHVITVIAWIGSSFYFVFLDNNLIKPTALDLKEKGVDGALWAVHGGGFYNPQKYMVAPKAIDSDLHWFYWEAYSTFLSGFALFTVLYLFNAETFLVDKSLMTWSGLQAGLAALGFLIGFWLIYNNVCRIFGFKQRSELYIGLVMVCVVGIFCYISCQLFAGRAAFLIVGASIATAMSANVFFWIIPGQKTVVSVMTSGQPYNPSDLAIHGKRGKQRSVHNTYFTLPVLFAMLSNHYHFLYSNDHPALVLFFMMVCGALIRQYFVQRHAYLNQRASNPWPFAVIGLIGILAVIYTLRPQSEEALRLASTKEQKSVTYSQVQHIFETRCYTCHGAAVQMKNVRLDSPENVAKNAQNIYLQAVTLKQMPMNNATGITQEERDLLAAWFNSGADTSH
jgi:uncharacterized membrane protein